MPAVAELKLDTLQIDQDGRVVVVRLDHPPFNYVTLRVQREIAALVRAVENDDSVGAVVFTGALEDRYVAHFDIAEILASAEAARPVPESVVRTAMRGVEVGRKIPGTRGMLDDTPLAGVAKVTGFNETVLGIMRSPAVWIAAINGMCGGGGIEMSVCFDMRIAADDDSVQILLPELLIGLTTTVGAQRLVQLIGPSRALEMLLEGRAYTAQEALDLRLIEHVVPKEHLLAEALDRAHRYAHRNRRNVATQKRILNDFALMAPDDAFRAEGAANAAGVLSGVAPKALRAWIEMQRANGGESAFVTDLDRWVAGEVVDLNATDKDPE